MQLSSLEWLLTSTTGSCSWLAIRVLTSLANTLKAYIEQLSDNPTSILAGNGQYKDLIETQVYNRSRIRL